MGHRSAAARRNDCALPHRNIGKQIEIQTLTRWRSSILTLSGTGILRRCDRRLLATDAAGGQLPHPQPLLVFGATCGSRPRLRFGPHPRRFCRRCLPAPLFRDRPQPLLLTLGRARSVERDLATQTLLFEHIRLQYFDPSALALEGSERQEVRKLGDVNRYARR